MGFFVDLEYHLLGKRSHIVLEKVRKILKECKVCKKEITDDTAHQLNGNCAKCFLIYLNSNYIVQPKVPVMFFTIGIVMMGIIGVMVFLLLRD